MNLTIKTKLIFLGLAFALLGCSIHLSTIGPRFERQTDLVWTEYTVKEGRHDFKPNPSFLPFPARSFSGWAILDSSCWYNNLGVDNQDWNKLWGVSNWPDFRKNKNAFILAWRPYPFNRGWFELVLYENIGGKNYPQEAQPFVVQANKPFNFRFQCWQGKYTLFVDENELGKQTAPFEFRSIGWTDSWFGGNRKAPKDMRLWLSKIVLQTRAQARRAKAISSNGLGQVDQANELVTLARNP